MTHDSVFRVFMVHASWSESWIACIAAAECSLATVMALSTAEILLSMIEPLGGSSVTPEGPVLKEAWVNSELEEP